MASPACGQVEARRLSNVRMLDDDARSSSTPAEPASGASSCCLPIPGRRRATKKPFIRPEVLDSLPGDGRRRELRFASDDRDYVGWAMERLIVNRVRLDGAAAATGRARRGVRKRYEAKAGGGPRPVYLTFGARPHKELDLRGDDYICRTMLNRSLVELVQTWFDEAGGGPPFVLGNTFGTLRGRNREE